MTFDSSTETVAVLYDIENAPFEMLDYTLGKARKYLPCRMIVVSDWEKHPEQKRWNRLLSRPGFTFRQIDRKIDGKNSLDYALFDMAVLLRDEGVRRFFIITTDSDFIQITDMLREVEGSYIIGVGTEQASQNLRNSYDEFLCYPLATKVKREKKESGTEKSEMVEDVPEKKKAVRKVKKPKAAEADLKEAVIEEPSDNKKKKTDSTVGAKKVTKTRKTRVKKEVVPKSGTEEAMSDNLQPGNLQIHLPKSLCENLTQRAAKECVDMDQLVTYLLMRGLQE